MSFQNRAQKSVQSPVPIPIAQCVLPRATGTDATDGPSKGLQMGESLTHCQQEFDELWGLCQATADKLTDDVLLEIFDLYLINDTPSLYQDINIWHTLVHVCRRWRDLVFASPRRLDLRLLCRKATPVREMLDIWPALPIVIQDTWGSTWEAGKDNIIAALEHPDRVCFISLISVPVQWEALVAMQVPFPELTTLRLWSADTSTSVLPDSFLGGSAPRLQILNFEGIPFPAIPNLLLSASNLFFLALLDVPPSGYISPEAMVACLSSLNKLEILRFGFESPRSPADRPSPLPRTRVVLPALTDLSFSSMTDVTHYMEDFVTRIDTPVLDNFSIKFFPDIVLDVPHFKQLISRTKGLKPLEVARVHFDRWCILSDLKLNQQDGSIFEFRCDRMDSITMVCGQFSPVFSFIERLDFLACHSPSEPPGEDDMDPTEILELFRVFSAIRSLHVSRSLVPFIATALQGFIGPGGTDVLPNLRDIFLGGPAIPGTVLEVMQPFLTARELSGQPVVVHH